MHCGRHVGVMRAPARFRRQPRKGLPEGDWNFCAGMSLASPVGPARFGRTSPLHSFRHRLNNSLQQSAGLLQSAGMREAVAAGVTATACRAQLDRQPAPHELVHHRITGDGRCLFRALAQGDHQLSTGAQLPLAQETSRADELRGQVIRVSSGLHSFAMWCLAMW